MIKKYFVPISGEEDLFKLKKEDVAKAITAEGTDAALKTALSSIWDISQELTSEQRSKIGASLKNLEKTFNNINDKILAMNIYLN